MTRSKISHHVASMNDVGPSTQQPIVLMLLGLLLAMCVVVSLVLLSGEVGPSHGVAHPQFHQSMQQGRSGVERHREVRWLGLAFGLLQVAFFVGCLLLGLRHRQGRVGAFAAVAILFAIAVTLMMLFDQSYAEGQTRQIVWGFPVPTALMVYGVGGVPLAFVVIYVLWFDRWILTEDEMAKFDRLVQERRRREEADQ